MEVRNKERNKKKGKERGKKKKRGHGEGGEKDESEVIWGGK